MPLTVEEQNTLREQATALRNSIKYLTGAGTIALTVCAPSTDELSRDYEFAAGYGDGDAEILQAIRAPLLAALKARLAKVNALI